MRKVGRSQAAEPTPHSPKRATTSGAAKDWTTTPRYPWSLRSRERAGFDFRNKTGDGGSAHGAFQWHGNRRQAILAATGINIDTADHRQQLEAAFYEGTKGERAGFLQNLNGRSLGDAVFQGVHRFEGSANQVGDTAKRLQMAKQWDGGGSFMDQAPGGSSPCLEVFRRARRGT